MGDSDTQSQASVATGASRKVLRWRDFEDGLVGRANHSVKHPIVTALTSIVSQVAPGTRLHRDLEQLPTNHGKYRPFIVTQKPRGYGHPPQIVLVTHFSGCHIDQLDACSKLLAVALGTYTPPHPLPTSPRIMIEPEWTEENSYAIAYPIKLENGRRPTRLRSEKGEDYHVSVQELMRLHAVCVERTRALATMPEGHLDAIKVSYETHRIPAPFVLGSHATNSHVAALASIAEDEPATPIATTAKNDSRGE